MKQKFYKNKNKKMSSIENNNYDNYSHLSEIEPSVQNILDTPIHLISEENLVPLWNHFQGLQEEHSDNPELVYAAKNIQNKVENIIALLSSSDKKRSWEIMKAANDSNYS